VGTGVTVQYSEFVKVEKIREIFDKIAYASLALDFGIAILTLFSLNASLRFGNIQFTLNVLLSVEVGVVAVLMTAMLILRHYQKILFNLAQFSRSIKGGPHARMVHVWHRKLAIAKINYMMIGSRHKKGRSALESARAGLGRALAGNRHKASRPAWQKWLEGTFVVRLATGR
jgi:hypothetical protein